MFIEKPLSELIPMIETPENFSGIHERLFEESKFNLEISSGEHFPIKAGFKLPKSDNTYLIVNSDLLPIVFSLHNGVATYVGLLRKTVDKRLEKADEASYFRFRGKTLRKLTGRELISTTMYGYKENLLIHS